MSILVRAIQNPYYTFRSYLAKKYSAKVFRISIDGFQGCRGRCIFCEQHFYSQPTQSLEDQVEKLMFYFRKRYRAKQFYLYLQKGTNTDAPVEKLREYYDHVLSLGAFVGFIVGTRPDCVNEDVIALLADYEKQYDVWIEYGLQSSHNRTLDFIKRNHSYEDFLHAVEITARRGLKITVHLILGLPGESITEVVETVRRLSALPIQGIKFHHLYILENTPLAEMYALKQYIPLTYEEYKETVITALRHLRPDIVVHRIVGDDTTGKLIAPMWALSKEEIIYDIKETMNTNGFVQGDLST